MRAFWIALAFVVLLGGAVARADGSSHAAVLTIDGAIGPATSEYVHRGLARAEREGAELVILEMNTPGGLDDSMRDIIRDVLESDMPIVSYVAPKGARAASAGTYILQASHVAAMAPATNLGAATPVQIGGLPTPGGAPTDSAEKGDEDHMRNKIVNDARAYMRALAQARGRNAEWAERSVTEAASLSADEAKAENVIDVVAPNREALLQALDGRRVKVGEREVTLSTRGMTARVIEADLRTQVLQVITNPNVAYLLMLIGIYGLIFELANPGFVLPGVVGAICLVIALFALQMLPVNYAGLMLLLLGAAFMIGEAFAPNFGVLGIGGIAAFVLGSLMLLEPGSSGYDISTGLIIGVTVVTAVFMIGIVGTAWRSRRAAVVSGVEGLLGSEGTVIEDFVGQGMVRAQGEIWQARADVPLQRGQRVKIRSVDGLEVAVEPQTRFPGPPRPQIPANEHGARR